MSYETELAFAKNLAEQAYVIARKYYKTDLAFETKSDASPVTIADKEINHAVIDAVMQQFPEHGVLGEEESWHEERSLVWVCDPIDGTIAFSMGEPNFMFSIALVKDGLSVMAVTADLFTGDTFWAVKEEGAYMNDKPLHVSNRPMDQSWIAFPTNITWLYKCQSMYQAIADKAYQTNVIHGGVFKGMLVAQGLADAIIWPDEVHPWDVAAVKLIVDEAGGSLTDRDNQQQRCDRTLTNGVIVSNGIIHDDLLQIIRGSLQD